MKNNNRLMTSLLLCSIFSTLFLTGCNTQEVQPKQPAPKPENAKLIDLKRKFSADSNYLVYVNNKVLLGNALSLAASEEFELSIKHYTDKSKAQLQELRFIPDAGGCYRLSFNKNQSLYEIVKANSCL